ncbi:AraC family transcriptional regulator [Actinomycetospora sp. OC33-EN08]|uniref:AraC family transcriptional regulator n=1 Tax=Actinomycetospora aurantiaca TaxID=3129233 RepID=A0ABU8MVT4_9PSEU
MIVRPGRADVGDGGPVQLHEASLAAASHLPARLLDTSEALGWLWPLVQVFEQPPVAEEFETPTTSDLLAVMVLTGRFRVESRAHGDWATASYHRGTIGITAPGQPDILRWRGPDVGNPTTLHVHLPSALLAEVHDAQASPRRRFDLNALERVDPAAGAVLSALHTALQRRAEPLVAESLAQALAAQLMSSPGGRRSPGVPQASAPLPDRVVERVTEYMRAHLEWSVSLEDLAREANLSKYHFLRRFTARVGVTPHRYLTDLRMERAAELLVTGDLSVSSVAALCGYAGTSRFTTLFHERHGMTPGDFRRRP